MTQQQIIEDITSRIASYPEETRELLYVYEIDRLPSVKAITEGYAKYGNKFLEDFASVTSQTSNTIGWIPWVGAVAEGLGGVMNVLSAASDSEATRELEIQRLKTEAEREKKEATSNRIILCVVGAIAIAGILVAVFYLNKKKK